MLLPVAALILASLFAQASPPLIVDTDAGVDDYMAIAFLLSRGDVHIEAVCLAIGLSKVEAGVRNITRLLALDATFLDEIQSSARTPLARFVAQVLASERDFVKQGLYYAWDPLAAVALVDRAVVSFTPLHVDVRQKAPEAGRTAETLGKPNAQVALDADAARFRSTFLGSLQSSRNR